MEVFKSLLISSQVSSGLQKVKSFLNPDNSPLTYKNYYIPWKHGDNLGITSIQHNAHYFCSFLHKFFYFKHILNLNVHSIAFFLIFSKSQHAFVRFLKITLFPNILPVLPVHMISSKGQGHIHANNSKKKKSSPHTKKHNFPTI